MLPTKFKVLLGATFDGEIVFADVQFRPHSTFHGEIIFATSFYIGVPVVVDESLYVEKAESLVENSSDSWVLDQLRYFDCRPSYLVEELASKFEIDDIIDLSCYPSEITGINSEAPVFIDCIGAGQCNVEFNNFCRTTNGDLVQEILHAWNKYHLGIMPKDEAVRFANRIGLINSEIDEDTFISEWIKEEGLIPTK